MIDIQQMQENFKKLDYDKKREKVLVMLEKIKHKHEKFQFFHEKINLNPNIPENILVLVYTGILEVSNELEKWNKETENQNLKKAINFIEKIQEQEQLENEEEWNPDDLLKDI